MHNGTYDRLYNLHKHDHDASFYNSNTPFLGHVQYIPLEDYTFCIHLRLMVIIDVERYVNGQYKKDTNYDIALALLTHYSVIPEKTINELSELCFVSPASISRFVKLIGFHSFQEFKNACLNTLDISKTDYSPQIIKADKKDGKEIFQNYRKNIKDILI